MGLLVTCDVHFSARARNAYRFELFNWIKRARRRRTIDELIIVGDLTDDKEGHTAWLVNKVADEIKSLSELFPVTCLTGNHDYVSSESPFFEFLRHINNVSWLRSPSVSEYPEIGSVLFLPHDRNYEKEWPSWLKRSYDCVFTHCTFEGATAGFGNRLKGVSRAMFKNQKRVIAGDIHVPQKIGNITYVGAPYTINFGDHYKGRVIYISDEGKVEAVDVDIPQKRMFEIESIEDLPGLNRGHGLMQGDVVRVVFHMTQVEYEHRHALKQKVVDWGVKAGYAIECFAKTKQSQPSSGVGRGKRIVNRADDTALITAYAERVGLSPKTTERGLTLYDKSTA